MDLRGYLAQMFTDKKDRVKKPREKFRVIFRPVFLFLVLAQFYLRHISVLICNLIAVFVVQNHIAHALNDKLMSHGQHIVDKPVQR